MQSEGIVKEDEWQKTSVSKKKGALEKLKSNASRRGASVRFLGRGAYQNMTTRVCTTPLLGRLQRSTACHAFRHCTALHYNLLQGKTCALPYFLSTLYGAEKGPKLLPRPMRVNGGQRTSESFKEVDTEEIRRNSRPLPGRTITENALSMSLWVLTGQTLVLKPAGGLRKAL